jgi:hypothetical protein
MWEHKFIELFTTIIPQCFGLILLYFSLTNIKIEKKSYISSSVFIAVLVFILRPYVDFGVHSAIMMFVFVLIAVVWGRVNIIASVIYSIVTFAVGYVCEWLTFLFLGIIKYDMSILDTDPLARAVIGIIPLVLLFFIGITVYRIKNNIKNEEEETDAVIRKDS